MKINRRQKIKEMLDGAGVVYLAELVGLFPDVSEMTLRRDLDYFEKTGEAVRIHGGAQKKPAGSEPYYSFRTNVNREAKGAMAALCMDFIHSGRSIFLDSGTTSMELAKALPDNVSLSVITSGPNIAMEISRRQSAAIVMLGGQLNRDNYSVSGKLAEDMLDYINIDVAFVAASGFSLAGGFTCGNYNEGEVKKKVLSKANKKIMLLDSSKFDKNMMYTFAWISDIDILVTDRALPFEIEQAFTAAGKQIIFPITDAKDAEPRDGGNG